MGESANQFIPQGAQLLAIAGELGNVGTPLLPPVFESVLEPGLFVLDAGILFDGGFQGAFVGEVFPKLHIIFFVRFGTKQVHWVQAQGFKQRLFGLNFFQRDAA